MSERPVVMVGDRYRSVITDTEWYITHINAHHIHTSEDLRPWKHEDFMHFVESGQLKLVEPTQAHTIAVGQVYRTNLFRHDPWSAHHHAWPDCDWLVMTANPGAVDLCTLENEHGVAYHMHLTGEAHEALVASALVAKQELPPHDHGARARWTAARSRTGEMNVAFTSEQERLALDVLPLFAPKPSPREQLRAAIEHEAKSPPEGICEKAWLSWLSEYAEANQSPSPHISMHGVFDACVAQVRAGHVPPLLRELHEKHRPRQFVRG